MLYKMKYQYSFLQSCFQTHGCELLTTKDEILQENLNANKKFRYMAQCGHERSIAFTDFHVKGHGRFCKACTRVATSDQYKSRENTMRTNIATETKTFHVLTTLLENDFIIKRVYEGCRSDVIIKPKSVALDDHWMLVQLKGAHADNKACVRFRSVGGYENMLLFCVGFYDNDYKIWLFNGSECATINGITASTRTTNKYHTYEVKKELIAQTIQKYYLSENYKKDREHNAMIPVTSNCKKEHQYRMQRIVAFKDTFHIQYPDEMNTVYDCIINGHKVQDKLSYPHRSGFTVGLYKRIKKKCVPYDKGDCDFYWIHFPNSNKCFVFPEHVLYKAGYIRDTTCQGKMSLTLFPEKGKRKNTKEWTLLYLFDLDNLCEKQRLIDMFASPNSQLPASHC